MSVLSTEVARSLICERTAAIGCNTELSCDCVAVAKLPTLDIADCNVLISPASVDVLALPAVIAGKACRLIMQLLAVVMSCAMSVSTDCVALATVLDWSAITSTVMLYII